MFDSESASAPVFQCAQDIDRAYKNSLFFYFHEGEDIEDGEGEEDDEDDDDEDDLDDDIDDDE